MIILDVNNVAKDFGYGQLFEDVSFSLNEGECISIVGPNGCGKSTLLKIIAGIYKPDSGTISIKKGSSVAYLDQTSSDKVDDRKVFDVIKDAFVELNAMANNLKRYENLLQDTSNENYEKTLASYCRLVEQFSAKGGYDIDVSVATVCNGLGINYNMQNQIYTSLSGGEKTLVQLAKALLQKPELLLLDEPTNHLDIERIEWLEGYIKSFKGACVIVSHDRYFLDKMSNKILDLDAFEPKIYSTNYTGYLEQKQRDFEKQMAQYQDQQLVIKRLSEQIKYFSERGMATNSSTLCDRAHSLQTQLDRILAKKIEKPKQQKKLSIDFKEKNKTSKKVVEIKNFTLQIPNGKVVLDNVSETIVSGERVALLGQNGCGKSSLIKTILGDNQLEYTGEFVVGPSVKVGYLPQIICFDNDKLSALECFMNEVGVNEQKARQVLAGFEFYKQDVTKTVKNLSGGERIRLRLASLLQQDVNCLIFDEPTNHIDIPTKQVLEQALDDFCGTVIFISHDRYFINKLAKRIIYFDNKKLVCYHGNYDYFKQPKNK